MRRSAGRRTGAPVGAPTPLLVLAGPVRAAAGDELRPAGRHADPRRLGSSAITGSAHDIAGMEPVEVYASSGSTVTARASAGPGPVAR